MRAGRAGADDFDRWLAARRCAGRGCARHESAGTARTGGGRHLCRAGVRNALPTVTYPNHTTLITGVWPAKHGIPNNPTFDPLQKNMGGWYWYAAGHQGAAPCGTRCMTAAARSPACPGRSASAQRSIDYNVPEYWRANIAEDLKLVRALSTPGLVAVLEKATGLHPGAGRWRNAWRSDVGPHPFRRGADRGQASALHHRASARAGSYRT